MDGCRQQLYSGIHQLGIGVCLVTSFPFQVLGSDTGTSAVRSQGYGNSLRSWEECCSNVLLVTWAAGAGEYRSDLFQFRGHDSIHELLEINCTD